MTSDEDITISIGWNNSCMIFMRQHFNGTNGCSAVPWAHERVSSSHEVQRCATVLLLLFTLLLEHAEKNLLQSGVI